MECSRLAISSWFDRNWLSIGASIVAWVASVADPMDPSPACATPSEEPILQARQQLIPQFFGLCDLLFQLAHIGMAVGVV